MEAFGEALDEGDKGTAKAMSSAYKTTMLQTFCIPVPEMADADARSPKLKQGHDPEPVGGWSQWVTELSETIGICMSEEALSRVQKTHRGLLLSLSREQSQLYEQLGASFTLRKAQIGEEGAGLGEKRAIAGKGAFSGPTTIGAALAPSSDQPSFEEENGASFAFHGRQIGEECARVEGRLASGAASPGTSLHLKSGSEVEPDEAGRGRKPAAAAQKSEKAQRDQSVEPGNGDEGGSGASVETQCA